MRSICEPRKKTLRAEQGFTAGQTTDDWQLTAAVARAMISRRDYDLEESFREQCKDFQRTTLGWGGSTKRSMAEIDEFFSSNGKKGRAPSVKAGAPEQMGQGAGNGVAMKIAPIALLAALKRWPTDKLLEAVMAEGRATHYDDRASIAAYAVAWLIASLLRSDIYSAKSHIETIRKRHMKWNSLIRAVAAAEKRYSVSGGECSVSERLKKIHDGKWTLDQHVLREECGTSCFCLESVPFAIATFFAGRNGVIVFEPSRAPLEAVNAGGDTDTNASIVGAFVGADSGKFDEHMAAGLKNRAEIETLAQAFCDVFVK